MLNITGQNFIAGQRSSAGSKFVLSYDAATDEALPYQFAQATPEEIDQAAQAAALAIRLLDKLRQNNAPFF